MENNNINNVKCIKQYHEFNTDIIQNGYHIYVFKNSETSDSHKLIINLSNKIYLKRSDKCVALSNLSVIYYTRKNMKK